jgi:hypothetical protein
VPGANSRTVFSANDLNPRMASDRRNIWPDATSVFRARPRFGCAVAETE